MRKRILKIKRRSIKDLEMIIREKVKEFEVDEKTNVPWRGEYEVDIWEKAEINFIPPHRPKEITELEIEKMKRMHKEGMSIKKISNMMQRSRKAIGYNIYPERYERELQRKREKRKEKKKNEIINGEGF